MKKRILSVLAVTVLYVALAAMTVADDSADALTAEQTDELMKQYVKLDQDCEPFEEKYLPCGQIASCKVFGKEQAGDYNYVYADVLDETYVLFEGRAYSRSGGHMPVKMKVKEEDSGIKLLDVRHPEDGDDYWESLKDMYPGKYLWQYEYYYNYNYESLYNMLEDSQEKQLKKLWGENAALERNNIMDIEEDGSYQIWNAKDGPAEEFEVVVVKEGRL